MLPIHFVVENYNTARDGRSRRGKSIPVRMLILSYAKETIYTHKQKGAVAGAGEGLEGGEIATFQPNPYHHRPLKGGNTNAL